MEGKYYIGIGFGFLVGIIKSRLFFLVDDGIYYLDYPAKEHAAIMFFNFATRKVTEVISLGNVAISWEGFAVSPDGQTALYAVTDQSGKDIMLVDNLP